MKNLKLNLVLVVATAIGLTSCHKDKKVVPTVTPVTTGLYVLNQGVFNYNNSTLTYYSYTAKQPSTDFFSAVNGRGLGDTGNDIEIYGAKMYIVVNVSSTIEVIDPYTGKSIKQIKMFNGTTGREPRDIAFYKGNAYITSYDGTVAVMDTTSLAISKYIAVGNDPEQLTVANGKIYVANSGGLKFPNYDKTVSVIDPSTNTVIKTLTVVENPQDVTTDGKGHVYVLSAGNYANVPSSLAIIDDNNDTVTSQTNFDATVFTVVGSNAYFITSAGKVGVYSTSSQSVSNTNFISDGTVIKSPFAINADAATGEVFVTDAVDYTSNGKLYAFDKNGKLEYSFTTGINPGRIALLKN
jgi:YVTN family beta-propeller protein